MKGDSCYVSIVQCVPTVLRVREARAFFGPSLFEFESALRSSRIYYCMQHGAPFTGRFHHHLRTQSNPRSHKSDPNANNPFASTRHTTTTMLKNCKLTYFAGTGRGEATRLALTIGQIPFVDQRVPYRDWPELKATTPWGSVPILTLADGTTTIAQQRAILRLVGKETQLYPSTDVLAAAKVDELMDAVEDIGSKVGAIGQGLEQKEKEAARKAAVEEGGPIHAFLKNVDSFIATYGQDGYAVGKALTIADLYLYCASSGLVSGFFDGVPANALDQFSNIQNVRKTVRSHPAVVQYYDSLDSSIQMPQSFAPIE